MVGSHALCEFGSGEGGPGGRKSGFFGVLGCTKYMVIRAGFSDLYSKKAFRIDSFWVRFGCFWPGCSFFDIKRVAHGFFWVFLVFFGNL